MLKVVKTLDSAHAARAYAAACLRRERDPRVRYTPTPRDDGRWDVVKDTRKAISPRGDYGGPWYGGEDR